MPIHHWVESEVTRWSGKAFSGKYYKVGYMLFFGECISFIIECNVAKLAARIGIVRPKLGNLARCGIMCHIKV